MIEPAAATVPLLSPQAKRELLRDLVAARRMKVRRAPLSYAQERLWFLEQLSPGLAVYNVPLAVRLCGRLDRQALAGALAAVVRRHEVLRTRFRTDHGDGREGASSGLPVQVVAAAADVRVPLPLVDLRGAGGGRAHGREAEAMRLAAEEAARPFDLRRAPLLRACLLRLAGGEHVLLLTLHHIASDGWSLAILVGELAALYRGAVLPELPIQYADYAVWQREWLGGGTGAAAGTALDRQLEHWRRRLADLPALHLPLDRLRPAVPTHRGGWVPVEVPAAAAAALRRLGRDTGATPFMTLLAGFAALLARYSGQHDFAIGTVVANRGRRELEGLIGFFMNTLVLRTDLSGEPSFGELLRRVREVTLDAYSHQDLPFEKLVEELRPARDTSRTPLVQVTLVLQNAPPPAASLPGLTLSPLPAAGRTAKFELSLSLSERAAGDGGIGGIFEHSSDLFEAATVERMAGHFVRLLSAAAAAPARCVATISMLDPAERQLLLVDGNRTTIDWGAGAAAGVHELVAAQAARTPEAVAVISGELLLTAGELRRRATRLARQLRPHAGPETLVGVCLERSAELVTALLAVLEAGGAYVPLDPDHPPARLQAMGEEARLTVVITRQQHQDLVAATGRQLLCVDGDDRPGAGDGGDRGGGVGVVSAPGESAAASRSGSAAGPDNAVYAIFTSGSTGRPKGAVNTHRGVANRLLWMQAAHGLTGADRVLQKTPFSFDVSVWELFWPLLAGAAMVVARPGGHRDPDYLAGLIESERVTVAHFVPSLLEAFLAAGGMDRCATLRRVFASGEALSWELQRRFFACSAAELHNLYGPTEAAVDVSAWRCEAGGAARPVPIGRPIANLQVYVVDEQLEPSPVGVPGELWIGGVGVARGYLGQAALTAERFVPDPWSPLPGGRLYRSGDLARRRAGGEIEYLGRLDQQIKLRGVRIEPGEIEAVLGQCPGVREAVVLLRRDAATGPRLVAYVVPAGAAPAGGALVDGAGRLTAGGLRLHCRQRLPEAMVPTAYVVLERWPLTASGKLDRRALPAPEPGAAAAAAGAAAAPRTPLEEILAGIWAEVLGRERIGVEDDFFTDLGGHSLLATQVVSRVRHRLGLELPLRSLFEAPTVSRWAALAAGALAGPGATATLSRRPAGGAPPPLSFAQERLWFLEQLAPGLTAYNMPFAVRLRGRLRLAALDAALDGVVRRHEVLRTAFRIAAATAAGAAGAAGTAGAAGVAGGPDAAGSPRRAGQPVQVITPAGELPVLLPVVDLRGLVLLGAPGDHGAPGGHGAHGECGAPGEHGGQLGNPGRQRQQALGERELARRVAEEAALPFDLAIAPPLRARLVRLDDDDQVLLLTLHHIAGDGWSLGVLVHELGALYAGQPLPELPIQYADYALWQRAWLAGDELDRQLAYWRRQLAGLPVLQLPADRTRPALQSYRGGQVEFAFAGELADGLRRLSRQQGVTLFMTLLAGFAALLGRYSGQHDLAVGTAVANRGRQELEPLIGFFVNTLVLRVDLAPDSGSPDAGGPSVPTLLRRVREMTLGAYGHQDLPFEKLVEQLRPARDTSRGPLVQVSLMLQNTPPPRLRLPGIELGELPVPHDTAKFDLLVSLGEAGAELAGACEYNADLFEPDTIARLAGHFRRLLAGMVPSSEPNAAGGPGLFELPLLDDEERRAVLVERNRTAVDWGCEPLVHELFEMQAARTPHQPAVSGSGLSLTYAELDRRANRLARRLADLGVGPEQRVGLCLDRGPRLLVAVLAVLKAGGAYLPLDPAYPAERLGFMIDDAAPRLVLAAERHRHLAGNAPVLLLTADPATDDDEPPTGEPLGSAPAGSGPLASRARQQNAAYVIYTSGSTGRPKGVVVPHCAWANFLLALRGLRLIDAGRTLLSVTTLAFDIAGLELLLPLISGAAVDFAGDEERLDGERLRGRLADPRIQTLQATPATWQLLLAAGFKARPDFRALCGGEALTRQLASRLLAAVPSLWNLYGPTETTIWSATLAVAPRHLAPAMAPVIPLGQPIANTRLYVLDGRCEPTPPGVPGELFIGGDGVARGYLGRPRLTAERFVPDPFAPAAGGRLYRTGDRARWRSAGELEYLGRTDHQIKLRGFRIEPGEIEAVLCRCPGVGEAVVLLQDPAAAPPGAGPHDDPALAAGRRLVAYLVPAGTAPVPAAAELRRHCHQLLPEPMVPAAFVTLPAWPRTANGKLDRAALPQPGAAAAEAPHAVVAPRNQLERTVAGIWQELLQLQKVGVEENFFDLGGHSLLLVRLRAEIEARLACECSIVDFFRYPTVAALARFLAQPPAALAPLTAPQADQLEDGRGRLQQQLAARQGALRKRRA